MEEDERKPNSWQALPESHLMALRFVRILSPFPPPPEKRSRSYISIFTCLYVFIDGLQQTRYFARITAPAEISSHVISTLAIFLPSNSKPSYWPLFRIFLVVVIICHLSRHPFLVLFGHSPLHLAIATRFPYTTFISIVACDIMYQLYL